jgi:hypothetical protein
MAFKQIESAQTAGAPSTRRTCVALVRHATFSNGKLVERPTRTPTRSRRKILIHGS